MPVRHQILQDRRFHNLMPYRVREVLLVSSPYDAFILEEDGQLTEQVFFEYRDVSLSGPPRVTHVATGEEALLQMQKQRFDLILVMASLSDMGVNALGRKVKELRPGRPVVLLALDRKELDRSQELIDTEAIDAVFLWTGDSQILLAVIKYIEDRDNVDHDIEHGNVRVILMVEDSPRFYSAFLGLLYKELMNQSHSLYSEGVNELHRRMYMRSRPKVLHAKSYEQAVALFERYQRNVTAVVTDVRIPRGGVLDPGGGLAFAAFARQYDPELPVLLQSAEPANAEQAAAMDVAFVDKNSKSLLAEIREFLRQSLGFGEFVFRTPDGEEVARAADVRELERQLAVVPDESITYHAMHNHFSLWLMARSEFELAGRIRPRQVSDFPSVAATREYLIQLLRQTRQRAQRGVIADFSREQFARDLFSRFGQGSLGGKARGIAFMHLTLAGRRGRELGELDLTIPKTVVLTTECFDRFMEENQLADFAAECEEDAELAKRFRECRFDDDLRSELTFIAHEMTGPLAVRSSSLLEDSLHLPLAGIYNTLMIPNLSKDPEVRLRELATAVKIVYASTYFHNARTYLQSTGCRVEEEKMAVIVQRLVGRRHGARYYPNFAGVAQSHNFYPIGPQRAEDGIVHVALGLGRQVIDGGLALRFSPRHPGVIPQLATPRDMLDGTQRGFYALDLDHPCCADDGDFYGNVKHFDLEQAEADGTLLAVGSVFRRDEERLRENLGLTGPRVVSFNNILKHRAIPLAEALAELLALAERGLGCPVEMEFACDMGDWGRPPAPGRERARPVLYPLQVRPFAARGAHQELGQLSYRPEETLCVSERSLGHGIERAVQDIVYVRRQTWEANANKAIVAQIGEFNRSLGGQRRPYLLIGPGRWGTADPWLGIPVQWGHISNVRVIVEASPAGYGVEPSQGTHFFQNITSLRVGYLTVPPGADKTDGHSEFLDWAWLDGQPAARETRHLRHVRLETPLTVVLDGREGRGLILKPGARG